MKGIASDEGELDRHDACPTAAIEPRCLTLDARPQFKMSKSTGRRR